MTEDIKKKIEEAKANGYTEEEINAYLMEKGYASKPNTSNQPLQPINPNQGMPTSGGPTGSELGILGGSLAAGAAGTAALGTGALLGKKLFFDPYIEARKLEAQTNAMREARLQAGGGGGRVPATQLPVNQPVQSNVYQFPQQARPVPGPVAPPTQQPSMMSQVQRMAFNKLKALGTIGAVGAGGAALSQLATQQMANMSPEERKRLYDNSMLSAMSGDYGLGAAIMNRGQ